MLDTARLDQAGRKIRNPNLEIRNNIQTNGNQEKDGSRPLRFPLTRNLIFESGDEDEDEDEDERERESF